MSLVHVKIMGAKRIARHSSIKREISIFSSPYEFVVCRVLWVKSPCFVEINIIRRSNVDSVSASSSWNRFFVDFGKIIIWWERNMRVSLMMNSSPSFIRETFKLIDCSNERLKKKFSAQHVLAKFLVSRGSLN